MQFLALRRQFQPHFGRLLWGGPKSAIRSSENLVADGLMFLGPLGTQKSIKHRMYVKIKLTQVFPTYQTTVFGPKCNLAKIMEFCPKLGKLTNIRKIVLKMSKIRPKLKFFWDPKLHLGPKFFLGPKFHILFTSPLIFTPIFP